MAIRFRLQASALHGFGALLVVTAVSTGAAADPIAATVSSGAAFPSISGGEELSFSFVLASAQ